MKDRTSPDRFRSLLVAEVLLQRSRGKTVATVNDEQQVVDVLKESLRSDWAY